MGFMKRLFQKFLPDNTHAEMGDSVPRRINTFKEIRVEIVGVYTIPERLKIIGFEPVD